MKLIMMCYQNKNKKALENAECDICICGNLRSELKLIGAELREIKNRFKQYKFCLGSEEILIEWCSLNVTAHEKV